MAAKEKLFKNGVESSIVDIEEAFFTPIQTRRRPRKVDPKLPIAKEQINPKELNLKTKEPDEWQQTINNIREMRSNTTAPVDSMGCNKCADETADEKTQRFQKLVALMLSSQTKDEVTFSSMMKLKQLGLNPENIASMDTSILEQLLYPVSFYKNKAKHLLLTSKIIMESYDSDIPDTVNELLKLPGVGPKMAHICMSVAWQKTSGIGVDVHVNRIVNRLNWVPKGNNPEKTRQHLESWVPKELWSEINHLLVGFGQTICTPQNPKCYNCLNNNICPSAVKPVIKLRQ